MGKQNKITENEFNEITEMNDLSEKQIEDKLKCIQTIDDEEKENKLENGKNDKKSSLNPNAASFSMNSNGSKYVNESNLNVAAKEFTSSEETPSLSPEYKLLHSMILQNMSYVTMEGMFQKEFKHKVPRYIGDAINMEMIDRNFEDQQIRALIQDIGPRINITWRYITKHNDNCPLSDNSNVLNISILD